MENRAVIERIMKNMAFEVEPIHDHKAIQETSTSSKQDPLNVKIKVRKKEIDDNFKRGFISNNQSEPEMVPRKVRLKNSDETIVSFDMFMEKDEKKPSEKPRKHLFERFAPGTCLKPKSDEDSEPYMPDLSKSDGKLMDIKRTDRYFLGKKCKPGGCLDPPFDEDTHAYEPVVVPLGQSAGKAYIVDRQDDGSMSSKQSTENLSTKRQQNTPIYIKPIEEEGKMTDSKPNESNMKPIRQSIITYKPEDINQDTFPHNQEIINETRQRDDEGYKSKNKTKDTEPPKHIPDAVIPVLYDQKTAYILGNRAEPTKDKKDDQEDERKHQKGGYIDKNKTNDTEPLKFIPATVIPLLHEKKTDEVVGNRDEPNKGKKEMKDYNKPLEISPLQKKLQEHYDTYPYPDDHETPLIDQKISGAMADHPSYLRSGQDPKDHPPYLESGPETKNHPSYLRSGQDPKDHSPHLRSGQETKDHPSGLRSDQDSKEHPSYLRSGQEPNDHPLYLRLGQEPKDHPSYLRSGQEPKDHLSYLRSGQDTKDHPSDLKSDQGSKEHPSYLRSGQEPKDHRLYLRSGEEPIDHQSHLRSGQAPKDHLSYLGSGQETKDHPLGPKSDQISKDHPSYLRAGQDTKDDSSYPGRGQDTAHHPSVLKLGHDTKDDLSYPRPGQGSKDHPSYLELVQDTEDHLTGIRSGHDSKDHPSYNKLGQKTEHDQSGLRSDKGSKDQPSYLRSGQNTADLDIIKNKQKYGETKGTMISDTKKAELLTSAPTNTPHKNYQDTHLLNPGVQDPLLNIPKTLEVVDNEVGPNQDEIESENPARSFNNNMTRKTRTSNDDNYKSEPVSKSSTIYDSDTQKNVTDHHKDKRRGSKLNEQSYRYNRKSKDSSFSIKSVLQNMGPIRKSITHTMERDNKERKTRVPGQEKLENTINEPVNAFFIPPKGIQRESKSQVPPESSKRQSGYHKPIEDQPVEFQLQSHPLIPITTRDSQDVLPAKQKVALEDNFKDDMYDKQIKSIESLKENETKKNKPTEDDTNQVKKYFFDGNIDINKINQNVPIRDSKNTSATVVSDKIKYLHLDNDVTSDYNKDYISPIPHSVLQTEIETYSEEKRNDQTPNLISNLRNEVKVIEKVLSETSDKSDRLPEASSDKIKLTSTDVKLDTSHEGKYKEAEGVVGTQSIKRDIPIPKLFGVSDISDTHINERLDNNTKTANNGEIIEILSISDKRPKLERNFSETFEEVDDVNLHTTDSKIIDLFSDEQYTEDRKSSRGEKKENVQPTYPEVESYKIIEQQSKEENEEELNLNQEVVSTNVKDVLEYQGEASNDRDNQESEGRLGKDHTSGKEITSPLVNDFNDSSDITYPVDLAKENNKKQSKSEEEYRTNDIRDHDVTTESSYIESLLPKDITATATLLEDHKTIDTMFNATPKRIGDEENSLSTTPIVNFLDLRSQVDSTIQNSRKHNESQIPPTSNKISNDIESISLNLAFHTYVNNKNEKIFETILNEHDVPRYPNDSITVIASKIRVSSTENLPELTIPIDPNFDMIIKIKVSDQGQKNKNETAKPSDVTKVKATPNIPFSAASKTIPGRENVTEKPRERTQDQSDKVLHRTLADIYEQELVPLQNMIRDLKKEIDFLSEQRISLRKRVICYKKSAQRKKISQKFSFS